MTRRTTLTCLALLAAVAFAARLGLAVHARAWRSPATVENKNIAASLVGGKGFTYADWNYYGPTSTQAPPFPLLLAGLFKATGAVSLDATAHVVIDDGRAQRAFMAVIVLNAVAGAGLALLTYGAARTVGATDLAAVGAAALVAVWPTQVYAAQLVQQVVLVTCGLMGLVVLFGRSLGTRSAGAWTAFAVLGALLALAEPVFLPAVIVAGVAAPFLARRQWSPATGGRNGLILAMALVAIVGPWVARNAIVSHGGATVVKGSFWVSAWKGNNDFASGTDRLKLTARAKHKLARGGPDEKGDANRQDDMLDLNQKMEVGNQPEWFRERVFRRWALAWIEAHPKRYAELCGIRLAKTLTVDWDNPRSLSTLYVGLRVTLAGLTLAGLAVALAQRWRLLLPAALFGSALLAYTLTMTTVRYGLTLEPMQLALAAGALAAIFPAGRGGSRPAVDRPAVDRGFASATAGG